MQVEMTLPHDYEEEIRQPLFTFSLPSWSGVDGVFGLYFLSIPFWIELITIVMVYMGFAAFLSYLIYTMIIKPKRYDSTAAYLLGYGFLLPLSILAPFFMIQFFEIRNFIFRFILGVLGVLTTFRTTEAMYGFCPDIAINSPFEYASYFASFLVFSRDHKGNFIPTPFKTTLFHLFRFVAYQFITGTIQSFLILHKDMSPFGPDIEKRSDWLSLNRLFTWELYANNAVQAILFQMYLTTFFEGLVFWWYLCFGRQLEPTMQNPLFESRSPSDFWGRRWNLIIHRVLKGGVYKPVRKYFSRTVAVVAVFLASGGFHEFLLDIMCQPLESQIDATTGECKEGEHCFSPAFGGAMVFFLWQAGLVAIETAFGNKPPFSTMARTLPLPVRTALVAASGIPLAHFFCEPYVRSEFFNHGKFALPVFLKVSSEI